MSANPEMEMRIQALEAQLHAVYDNAPLVMFMLDSQGVFTLSEGQTLAKMGLKPGQLVGLSVFDVYKDYPDIIADVRRALAGQTVTSITHVGNLVFQTSYRPFPVDPGGGMIGIAINISEWHQAEQELKAQQRFLRKVIDALPARVFWKDTDLSYLGCNMAFARDAGVESPDMLIGKNDYDMGWKEQADLYRNDDRAVMESGTPRINFEEPQDRPDGSKGWLRTSKIPLYGSDGTITGVLGVYEDITERKMAEAEREQLQRRVIEAQQQALADLSTPIIPIMDNIIVMPLVGSIDTGRSRDIMRSLLHGISQYRAKVAILDITGVPVVDSGVADHLNHTIQAARLKGAHTIVTGISDAVAETIVDLGIDWSAVETLRDLQSGLIAALSRIGVRLTSANGGK